MGFGRNHPLGLNSASSSRGHSTIEPIERGTLIKNRASRSFWRSSIPLNICMNIC